MMGMREFQDGSLGQPEALLEALGKADDENVKALHVGTIDQLTDLKKKVDSGEKTNEDFKREQLNRIESMLGSIIMHLKIPYKGIITIIK